MEQHLGLVWRKVTWLCPRGMGRDNGGAGEGDQGDDNQQGGGGGSGGD